MPCKEDARDYCRNPTYCSRFEFCPYFSQKEQTEPRIPEFIQLLEASKEIHLRKNQDYASEENPFSNFERSALIASWFDDRVDKSFAILVGTKLARLAELLNGKTPKNESIYDTFLDLGTYCFLWGSYIVRKERKNDRESKSPKP